MKLGSNSPNSGYFLNKKGQVTVFMIVGLLILLTFAGIFYLTKDTTQESLRTEGEPFIASVPVAFEPIKEFTESCLQQVAKKGLVILGNQGGYIDPGLVAKFSSDDPTNADGLILGSSEIPYWHYNSFPNEVNKINLVSLQPPLLFDDDAKRSEMSIEAQLDRYVAGEIDSCLNNYKVFKGQGFAMNYDKNKKVTTEVTDNYVNFLMEIEVKGSKGEKDYSLDKVYVKLPLELKKYYQVSQKIKKIQMNYSILEKQALDLIQIYSAVDREKLPPTTGVAFDLGPGEYWNVKDVKDNIKGVLNSNVPLLRFIESNNFYNYEFPNGDLSELYQATYNDMVLPLPEAEDLSVTFDYFNWEPYVKVTVNDDQVKPFNIGFSQFGVNFATQRYMTVYDLSYPVLITIRDENAFNGEGYTFKFVMESNVRKNRPVEDQSDLPIPIVNFEKSMVCDKDKFDTGIIKSKVVDSYTGEPVDYVQIGFTVPKEDNCFMGLTGDDGTLEKNYPSVYGGVITFIKEGYLSNFYPIDTYKYLDKGGVVGYAFTSEQGLGNEVVPLHKFHKVKVRAKKKNIEKCINDKCFYSGNFFNYDEGVYSFSPMERGGKHKWVFSNVALPLFESEKLIITLKKVKDLNDGVFNDGYKTSFAISGDEEQEIKLVPGVYEVSGQLLLDEEVVIPKEKRCTEGVIFGLGSECFNMPEQRIEGLLVGAINWKDKKSYLKITPDKLYNSDYLDFYTMSLNIFGVPYENNQRVIEDLEVMSKYDKISKDVRVFLEPTFS